MIAESEPAEIIREKFAARLQDEMARRNWNQSELARRASAHLVSGEISRDNISNYVRQRALPGPAFLLAIAKAFNTTSTDLLPERGAPPARDGGALPATHVQDSGDGMAFVRVNRRLPWSVALDILSIINDYQKEEYRANMGPREPDDR